MGWEGAGTATADLSAVDEDVPAADAPRETQIRARMHRFTYRALHVGLVPTMATRGADIELCIQELRRLRTLRPDVPQFAMNLHWALTVMQKPKEADDVADEFLAGDATEPQSCSYFARAFSKRGKYDDALRLCDRTRTLDDYLGDEIALERMRAHAGKGDVTAAIGAYERRIGELKADLDQFHFAYHLAISTDDRGSEFAGLFGRLHHGLAFGAATPEGLPVMKVEDGTPGAEAGLKAGDLIVEADGRKPQLSVMPVLKKNWETIPLKVTRGAEKLDLKLKLVSVYLHEVERLAMKRNGDGKRQLIHVLNCAATYSRLVGEDAQIELLTGAVEEFKHVFGFRHYVYRTAFRIVETGGKDTPD